MESLGFTCELYVESKDIGNILGDWEKHKVMFLLPCSWKEKNVDKSSDSLDLNHLRVM